MWRRIMYTMTTLNYILARHDSLLWLQYAAHWEDLWHRNLCYFLLISKSSKQVHKVVISKDFCWSSYNIQFVSFIIMKYHHHHLLPIIMQHSIESLTFPHATHKYLIIIQAKRGKVEPCLTGIGEFEPKVSRLSSVIKVLYL